MYDNFTAGHGIAKPARARNVDAGEDLKLGASCVRLPLQQVRRGNRAANLRTQHSDHHVHVSIGARTSYSPPQRPSRTVART